MAILVRCKCKTEAKLGSKFCPGCGEPYPKKDRVYKVVLRAGHRKITKTVHNLELAREIQAKIRVDITREGNDIQRKKPAPLLSEVWKRYLPWAEANKKSWYQDFCNYEKHLEPAFGRLPLDKISQFDVEKLTFTMRLGTSKLGRPYATATIKQQLILLSHMYTLAGQWGMFDGPNPCKHVKKPRINNQKTEHLADSELRRLLDTLDNWPDRMAASIVRFALYTGLRRGEIFRLTRDDVDMDRQTVRLRDPKGGVDQHLPLSDDAVEILESVPKKHRTPWIFYGRNGLQRKCIRAAWGDIRRAAGLPQDFRFHGLRHHFASALVSAGVDLYTVQTLLTHKDAKTTQRYAHLSDKTLRNAVNLSEKILNPEKKKSLKEAIADFIFGDETKESDSKKEMVKNEKRNKKNSG